MNTLAWAIVGAPSAFFLAQYASNNLSQDILAIAFWGVFVMCLAMALFWLPKDIREIFSAGE